MVRKDETPFTRWGERCFLVPPQNFSQKKSAFEPKTRIYKVGTATLDHEGQN